MRHDFISSRLPRVVGVRWAQLYKKMLYEFCHTHTIFTAFWNIENDHVVSAWTVLPVNDSPFKLQNFGLMCLVYFPLKLLFTRANSSTSFTQLSFRDPISEVNLDVPLSKASILAQISPWRLHSIQFNFLLRKSNSLFVSVSAHFFFLLHLSIYFRGSSSTHLPS